MNLYYKLSDFNEFGNAEVLNETRNLIFTVKGKEWKRLGLGNTRHLVIYDSLNNQVGSINGELISYQTQKDGHDIYHNRIPYFNFYNTNEKIGALEIQKGVWNGVFLLDLNNWTIKSHGALKTQYEIFDANSNHIAVFKKVTFDLAFAYEMNVFNEMNVLAVTMIVSAIHEARAKT